MKTEFKYAYDDNELSTVCKMIKKYRTVYNKLLLKYNEYVKNITNSKEHRNIMFEYREEIISFFKKIINNYIFFKNNVVFYLSGSFSRNTVRMFSDIDLNLIYIDGDGKEYEKYEELFYYMISEICSKPRSCVHSIVTAFNDKNNIKYVLNNMNEDDINVVLKDKNTTIEYKIPYLYKKRFYLQYINNKNYKIIFDNLLEIYKDIGIREWMNNMLFLNNNVKAENYYNNYINELNNKVDISKLKKLYKEIIDVINEDSLNKNLIKDIKYHYQMKQLHFMYNAIIIIQMLDLESDNLYYNFKDILKMKNKMLNKVVNLFYDYNYEISILNNIFEQYGLDYSIHTNQIIDINKYSDLNKQLTTMDYIRKKINKIIISILEEEFEKYDKK